MISGKRTADNRLFSLIPGYNSTIRLPLNSYKLYFNILFDRNIVLNNI